MAKIHKIEKTVNWVMGTEANRQLRFYLGKTHWRTLEPGVCICTTGALGRMELGKQEIDKALETNGKRIFKSKNSATLTLTPP